MSSWMSGSYIKEWWHLWIKIVAIKYMKTKSSILSKMAHGWNRIWKWNISAAVSDDETSMTKVHCGLHACSTVARDSDWEWKVHRELNTKNFQEFQNWTCMSQTPKYTFPALSSYSQKVRFLRRTEEFVLTPHVQASCSHYSWAQHCPTQWPNNLPSKVESERHNESMDFSWDLKRNWGYYLNLASSPIAPRLIVSLCMKFLFQKDTPFWQGTLLLSYKTGVIYHHGHRWLSDTDVGSTVGTAFWPVCLLQKCTYISPANSCIVTPHKLSIFWSHPQFCVKVGCRQTSEYWVLML